MTIDGAFRILFTGFLEAPGDPTLAFWVGISLLLETLEMTKHRVGILLGWKIMGES